MRINSAGQGGHSMMTKRVSGGVARTTKCLVERRAGSVWYLVLQTVYLGLSMHILES